MNEFLIMRLFIFSFHYIIILLTYEIDDLRWLQFSYVARFKRKGLFSFLIDQLEMNDFSQLDIPRYTFYNFL